MIRLQWDRRSLTLVDRDGLYGRMARLPDGTLLCVYEKGGRCWVRRSKDAGRSWASPTQAAAFAQGGAANPEIAVLKSGLLLLPYNARPQPGSGGRFAIGLSVSTNGGVTWTTRPSIFVAGETASVGCWEPAALQLPSGEILLFFANEKPYPSSDEQEISVCRSRDDGKTWSAPQTVCFRKGHRDGMPVPLLLKGADRIVVAIEDNGLAPGALLQPALISLPVRDVGRAPAVGGDSPRRWGAVTPSLAPSIYAGAPYLCQLPGGETLLSCQSMEDRREAPGGGRKARMVVYVGDKDARNFRDRSTPFELSDDVEGMWNALFVKNADTVTALSSTTIDGVRGLWTIDGRVLRR